MPSCPLQSPLDRSFTLPRPMANNAGAGCDVVCQKESEPFVTSASRLLVCNRRGSARRVRLPPGEPRRPVKGNIVKLLGDTSRSRRGTVEPLWGPRGLQANGFELCPRSECMLGFLTRGNGFLAGAAVVQWNHACFGVRGVSKRTSSNPVHGPSVDVALVGNPRRVHGQADGYKRLSNLQSCALPRTAGHLVDRSQE
ncbi:hypothetical protein E2C01_000355 [Portunus trituberculatus]|uniref:Uncharacterized protein n=1 Tax=Portunus trituberculatus TaxID=210409 RepID=A0A5B7CEX4_PORTR|nr:hypothetical protein [Portunus trituberculatus]